MEKIAIITNMMSFYRLDLFNELVKNKEYDFHVIFSAEKENNRRNWEIDKKGLNFKYTVLKSRSIIKKARGIKEMRIINISKDVFKTLGRIKPDIIIGSEYNPTVIKAFIYCKLKRLKYISWSDGTLNSERFISKVQKILRKIFCRFSDGFIASSTETREAQVSYGARKDRISVSMLTIDNEKFALDLSNYEKPTNKIPVILFCGYLIRLKGIDHLLRALALVKNNFRFDIMGSGSEEDNLKELARELNITGKIRFLGYKGRNEIAGIYKGADIFVFPSMNDAFGLILVEAITAGLPVITSPYAGGSRDIVDEGMNGFIVDPEDAGGLAKKLDLLLSDASLRESMGKRSLEKSKSFSLKCVSAGFFEAIRRCREGSEFDNINRS